MKNIEIRESLEKHLDKYKTLTTANKLE